MGVESIGIAGVVAPMILQFFVLAVYWFGGVPIERYRVLLPFLMVSTGVLFFSSPLYPVWGPVVGLPPLASGPHDFGVGGLGVNGLVTSGFQGMAPGVALVLVLMMNVLVCGAVVGWTGGMSSSPYRALLFSYPLMAGALGLGGGGFSWKAGAVGVAALLPGALMSQVFFSGKPGERGEQADAETSGLTRHSTLIVGLGVGVLLALAFWLGSAR